MQAIEPRSETVQLFAKIRVLHLNTQKIAGVTTIEEAGLRSIPNTFRRRASCLSGLLWLLC